MRNLDIRNALVLSWLDGDFGLTTALPNKDFTPGTDPWAALFVVPSQPGVATLGDTVAVVDADNDPYQVLWELMSGTGSIEDPSALITSLTMQDLTTTEPYYCNQNQFVLRLTVTDCTGAYTQESTTMTGECCGIPASSPR